MDLGCLYCHLARANTKIKKFQMFHHLEKKKNCYGLFILNVHSYLDNSSLLYIYSCMVFLPKVFRVNVRFFFFLKSNKTLNFPDRFDLFSMSCFFPHGEKAIKLRKSTCSG